ncbi:MAG: alpha/beta hydrolase, partial [Actinomycetota bacterium]|nr:alpha/beta hydrolase [Actinomycetota bacterium]
MLTHSHRGTGASTAITGEAAGVPFVAVPPANGPRPSAPVVVAWHLMDPPRTEAAFAAAVPLDGLDAWRIYLGLPMSGSRLPAGGFDEVMRLGYEDAVLNLQRPVIYGAAEEFGPAFA